MNIQLRRYVGFGAVADGPIDRSSAIMTQFLANHVVDDQFLEHFGAPIPNPIDCLRIQCGGMTQAEAGPDLLFRCANYGYAGVKSCNNPLCAPWCGRQANTVAAAANPLPVSPRVEQTFRTGPARNCQQEYSHTNFGGPYDDSNATGDAAAGELESECCTVSSAIANHPIVSLALLFGAAWAIRQARARS